MTEMFHDKHEENTSEATDAAALASTQTIDECTVCGKLFNLHEGFGWNIGSDTNKPFFVCLPCCDRIPEDAILERIAATDSAAPAPAEALA